MLEKGDISEIGCCRGVGVARGDVGGYLVTRG